MELKALINWFYGVHAAGFSRSRLDLCDVQEELNHLNHFFFFNSGLCMFNGRVQ